MKTIILILALASNVGAFDIIGGPLSGEFPATYVLKAGDVMTGPLQTTTATITGNSFSVGGSSLVVANGNIGAGMTPDTTAGWAYQTAFNKMFVADSQTVPLFIKGGTASQIVINRSPLTGTFFDTGKAAASIAINSENGAGYLTFNTASVNNTNPSARMIVSGAGLVGIGNTNPDTKIHVSSGVLKLDGTTPGIIANGSGAVGAAFTSSDNTAIISLYSGADNAGINATSGINRIIALSNVRLEAGAGNSVIYGTGVNTDGWTSRSSRGIYARNATTATISSGTVVTYATQYTNTYGDIGVSTSPANSAAPVGTVFNTAGCAAGALCQICTEGLCPARLDSGSACATNNTAVLTGTEVGRAACSAAPDAANTHWQEIGQPAIFTAQNGHVIWIFAHRN